MIKKGAISHRLFKQSAKRGKKLHIEDKGEKMIPIVSIIGKSNSGKTTLLEGLIRETTQRGYRVATIKHNRHGFEIDHEGKDSWKHRRAGAYMTVIASPKQVALIESTQKDYTIAELRERYIREVDIILIEGYKQNPYPKIEVYRKEISGQPLATSEDNLIAMVTDDPVTVDVARFHKEDIVEITDLIVDLFLDQR